MYRLCKCQNCEEKCQWKPLKGEELCQAYIVHTYCHTVCVYIYTACKLTINYICGGGGGGVVLTGVVEIFIPISVAVFPISAINLKLYLTVTHDTILVPQDHNTNLNIFTGNDENEQNDNLPDIMSNSNGSIITKIYYWRDRLKSTILIGMFWNFNRCWGKLRN